MYLSTLCPVMILIRCSWGKKTSHLWYRLIPTTSWLPAAAMVFASDKLVQSRAFLCSFIAEEGSVSLEMNYRSKTLWRPVWLQAGITWLEGLLIREGLGSDPSNTCLLDEAWWEQWGSVLREQVSSHSLSPPFENLAVLWEVVIVSWLECRVVSHRIM